VPGMGVSLVGFYQKTLEDFPCKNEALVWSTKIVAAWDPDHGRILISDRLPQLYHPAEISTEMKNQNESCSHL
jgi:hypothetical protein